jgi:hypothetical protein
MCTCVRGLAATGPFPTSRPSRTREGASCKALSEAQIPSGSPSSCLGLPQGPFVLQKARSGVDFDICLVMLVCLGRVGPSPLPLAPDIWSLVAQAPLPPSSPTRHLDDPMSLPASAPLGSLACLRGACMSPAWEPQIR